MCELLKSHTYCLSLLRSAFLATFYTRGEAFWPPSLFYPWPRPEVVFSVHDTDRKQALLRLFYGPKSAKMFNQRYLPYRPLPPLFSKLLVVSRTPACWIWQVVALFITPTAQSLRIELLDAGDFFTVFP